MFSATMHRSDNWSLKQWKLMGMQVQHLWIKPEISSPDLFWPPLYKIIPYTELSRMKSFPNKVLNLKDLDKGLYHFYKELNEYTIPWYQRRAKIHHVLMLVSCFQFNSTWYIDMSLENSNGKVKEKQNVTSIPLALWHWNDHIFKERE